MANTCNIESCEKEIDREELCLRHRLLTVNFGTVPGGAKDERTGISQLTQREKDLNRYRRKRQAGERPDGTTKEAMDDYDRRVDSWEKAERKFQNESPPETVQELQRTTFNERK